ncbi:MAG: hypothetical protein RB292_02135 [Patescibacteria group bacterium]|jgi:hypothetical protein|nr:hypothetical protein [Patescibacteria group bacterium]
MIFSYLKIILAILILWPRGYLLAYLIDRSKSFGFGFKFFVGWLLGIAGFTLDVFAANVFGHQPLTWWVFLGSSVTQIFGFGFMIFIAEKKLPWPNSKHFIPWLKVQRQNFKSWDLLTKSAFGFLVLTLIIRVGASLWQITYIPTYDFDAWNNWNLRAKVIYTQAAVPLDSNQNFYLGGGIKSYPLNDSIFKVWLAFAAGDFVDRFVNLASLIYYLLLLAIFYFSVPKNVNRLFKIIATYALSSLPLLYFHSHVPYADLLFSIFLFLTVISIFYFLAGLGNSYFYLSGIALAFSIWTKNEGLSIIFPVMVFSSLYLLIIKKLRFKDWFWHWFFAALTIFPWLAFRFLNRLDILSGDSSTFNLVFNSQFISEVLSSIFLRSHFNFLWLAVFMLIIFGGNNLKRSLSLQYLTGLLAVIFFSYNGIIIFTDKAYDLSALARINMQLTPLAVALIMFYFHKFFAKIKLS